MGATPSIPQQQLNTIHIPTTIPPGSIDPTQQSLPTNNDTIQNESINQNSVLDHTANTIDSVSTSTPSTTGHPLLNQLLQNPVFAGGAGIASLAAAAGILRSSLLSATRLIQRYYTTSLEVNSKDLSYQWLLPYIHDKTIHANHISIETTTIHNNQNNQYNNSSNTATNPLVPQFKYVPSPGQHYFIYHRHIIQITRKREQSMLDITTGLPYETVELKTIGRNRTIFTQLLTEARSIALQQQHNKTLIYVPMGLEWKQFGAPRDRRKLSSVVLDDGVNELLYNDISEFSSSKQWYIDRGIPYRRGYLLYGEPGCGKSSYISALAGELQYNICVLNLNERGLTDDRLSALMSVLPSRSFVLLEDIDAALPASRPNNIHEQSNRSYSVTFSGLLNVLDGVASGEERIIFMTTNYINRLDCALIRPGRIDRIQYIGRATKYQLNIMYQRFYPDQLELCQQFVDTIIQSGVQLSVAELQAYFLIYKNQPELAALNVQQLIDDARQREHMHQQQQNSGSNRINDTSHTASVSSATNL